MAGSAGYWICVVLGHNHLLVSPETQMKITQLARKAPLRSKTAPVKRSRINPMSKKRLSERKLRNQAIECVIARDGRKCFAAKLVAEIRCFGGLHGHELLPRSQGGSITNPDGIRMCCDAHNVWIHDHPKLSYERGLIVHRPDSK